MDGAIDIIICRTILYSAITAAAFAVYLLVVGGTSLLLQSRNDLAAGLIAIGLVAVGFVPARRRLGALMDRALPYAPPPEALAELEARRESTVVARSHVRSSLADFLRSHWIVLARGVWLVLSLAAIATWATALYVLYTGFLLPCTAFPVENQPFCVAMAQGLAQLGLSRAFYAIYFPIGVTIEVLPWILIGFLIFLRRSHEPFALFFSLMLVVSGTFALDEGIPYNVRSFYPTFAWLLNDLNFIGSGLLILWYLFPDGRFAVRWMRWLAVLWVIFQFGTFFLPDSPFDFETWPEPLDRVVQAVFAGSVLCSLVYRYRHSSNAVQRQQIKWVVASGSIFALLYIVGICVIYFFVSPGLPDVIFHLTYTPLHYVTVALVAVSLGFSILRYRLYDIDIIIRRTLIYGALVGMLALVYFGSVTALQLISQTLTGPQSNLVIVATTLAIAGLFQPVRRRVQGFVDRRFYREKIDFRQAFADFAREVRTIIELPELLRALVNRTTDLLHIAHGAVFLRDEQGAFQIAEARSLPPEAGATLPLDAETIERLEEGAPIARPSDERFPLLVPLIAPGAAGHAELRLIGLLALGPRLSDQKYSREDQALLTGLADQAGTAIHVAQLIEEQRAAARRREEAERQLEARRSSPIGRAEAAAEALLAKPQTALIELHHLADAAGQNPESAQLLEYLPRVIGVLDQPGAMLLTGLADGFSDLFFSQQSPALLPVGLRGLIDHLALATTDDRRNQEPRTEERGTRNVNDSSIVHRPSSIVVEGAAEALGLYRLCQQALEAATIEQIAELEITDWSDQLSSRFLSSLAGALAELRGAVEALRAYERVDSSQDKLAYLAGAIERLSRVDRLASAELGSADRSIVQRIVGGWLAIVTGAMSQLQTRAQLACRLLTRHTWQADMIGLVLAIRNDGRGAALNLSVGLAPAPEYTLLDEPAQIERLAAAEETEVTLRVRLRPGVGEAPSSFRARFLIRYADPRGPDQVEPFADEIQLLGAEEPFQFIPNPYVVGTPLQGGSPLFFGRADLMSFIEENLAAAHRNNLVLIGQRRTGKTSLLKQLPARLGDVYLPIYLDGQSLGLDPGLPNFFLALATEIAFALDDRGFSVAPPELNDFTASPAVTFERVFLAEVRKTIGERHVLLLLDEFEELEAAVRRGDLDPSIFGFLRHLIQHAGNLSVIFCGTHRLEELAADYWSVLFNISLYRHVGFLEREEAERLIQQPVAPYGMRYDDLALEKIWRVTAGHPYFLQLLCHSLVNRHNKSGRGYVTVADVNAALEEILAAGEAHFIYLWTESTGAERLALAALSRMLPLAGHARPAQVVDYLAERGVAVERRVITDALHRLALRDILIAADDANYIYDDTYRWRLGLLGLWAERYRSLNRVVDEVRS